MGCWQVGTKIELLKSYKRAEVKTTTCAAVPADWNIEKVFKSQCIDLATPEEKKELQVLSGVKGEQTWFKHTPTSEQERYAEMV